jgi:hypothetical protein
VVFNALCFFRSSILMATLSLTDWTWDVNMSGRAMDPMIFPLAAFLAQLGEHLAWHEIMLTQTHRSTLKCLG